MLSRRLFSAALLAVPSVARAREDYDRGDYRWVAEVVNIRAAGLASGAWIKANRSLAPGVE